MKATPSFWHLLALGAAALAACETQPNPAEPTPQAAAGAANAAVTVLDFETGNFAGWTQELKFSYSGAIVSTPVRVGSYAAKFTIRKNASGPNSSKTRAELRLRKVAANSEQWYAFSQYVPANYLKEDQPEIIGQWHAVGDDQKELTRNPPAALVLRNDRLTLVVHWDSRRINYDNQGTKEIDFGPVDKGRWTDWVFHYKWSYQNDGRLEVWKNGQPFVSYNGPNMFNDADGPFFKLGIYRPQIWREASPVNERVLYYDEVRVAGAGATYADVAPPSPEVQLSSAATPVTASADDGNRPANTLDANLGTRWSAQGAGQWIRYDLGAAKTLSAVKIAWQKGNERQASFQVQTSATGTDAWTTVYTGTGSGTSTGLETYALPATTPARYVRLVGQGNSANTWNSLTEVELYGR